MPSGEVHEELTWRRLAVPAFAEYKLPNTCSRQLLYPLHLQLVQALTSTDATNFVNGCFYLMVKIPHLAAMYSSLTKQAS